MILLELRIDQLTNGQKNNVEIIKSEPGSDPASVAFKAIQHAKDKSLNQVIIDTWKVTK